MLTHQHTSTHTHQHTNTPIPNTHHTPTQGKIIAGPTHNEGRAALEMARLNVSKDEAYGEQGSRNKVERGIGTCKHSVLALSLSTLHTALNLEVCWWCVFDVVCMFMWCV